MGAVGISPRHLLFETELLRAVDYRCGGQDGAGEQALDHEIVFPRSGSYVRRDAFGTCVADANQVLFFQRGQGFDIHHPHPGGDRSTDLALKGNAALDLVRCFDPRVEDHPERPFPPGAHTVGQAASALALSRLTAAARSGSADALRLEEATLVFLGGVLAQIFGRAAADGRSGLAASRDHRDAAARVMLLLRARLTQRLSLQDIAGQAGYSPFHLCRLFKRQTGLSIHAYRQNLRLRESLEQLVERPQRPVTEIALGLGFASHSHFCAAFQAHFATSPTEFRRRANRRALRELRKILKDTTTGLR
jgi:AraC-like DNA-binding protein